MRTMTMGDGDRVDTLRSIAGAGFTLRCARKRIRQRVVYRHAVDGYLLHVTLQGALAGFVAGFGGSVERRPPSRPGLISFTPPGHERYGALEDGDVVAVEIEMARDFVDSACEQVLALDRSTGFFNIGDMKATALAEALALRDDAPAGSIEADVLALALARHIGFRMAGAEGRRDDGWLHPAALRRVIERIEADPGAPARLGELAGLAGLGPSAFIRAFRGTTGQTPIAFMLDRRLDRSRHALRRDTATLETIAADHGFASKPHFIAAFRQRFGITPGQYRAAAG